MRARGSYNSLGPPRVLHQKAALRGGFLFVCSVMLDDSRWGMSGELT